jgi:hypothetical protein
MDLAEELAGEADEFIQRIQHLLTEHSLYVSLCVLEGYSSEQEKQNPLSSWNFILEWCCLPAGS